MVDLRMTLNDKAIAELPPPENGQYKARDTKLKGFYVQIGKRRRTFMVQGDLRHNGKRTASIKVSVGDAATVSSRDARAIAKSYLGEISQGRHPKAEEHAGSSETTNSPAPITLRQAWIRYHETHLLRKERSDGTIKGYRDHVERIFKDWLEFPLLELANNPALVATKHDEITKQRGPYVANGSMRTLRAIYNHARKTNKTLPYDNPAHAVDWNNEQRRDTAMGAGDLVDWFGQLGKLDNPVRREFHLLTLLSGCRPSALKSIKQEDIDLRRRILHIAKPKGGKKRAFDIPLSRQMIISVVRTIRFGRVMYPSNGGDWLFPAESKTGHIVQHRETRENLTKWGNDLRQSYRTLAAVAGVSEVDAKLLMNHAIPGVNSGYITRHKLLEDHLRSQQQAISDVIFLSARLDDIPNSQLKHWLGPNIAKRVTLFGVLP